MTVLNKRTTITISCKNTSSNESFQSEKITRPNSINKNLVGSI